MIRTEGIVAVLSPNSERVKFANIIFKHIVAKRYLSAGIMIIAGILLLFFTSLLAGIETGDCGSTCPSFYEAILLPLPLTVLASGLVLSIMGAGIAVLSSYRHSESNDFIRK